MRPIEAIKLLVVLLLIATTAYSQNRQVAITIDDLPRNNDGGSCTFRAVQSMTERLLAPFQEKDMAL